jgi:soluble lytic murein transglycosylase-like protein
VRFLCILAATTALAQDSMRASIEKQQAALAIQRESVRKQATTASVRLMPWNPAPAMPQADCDPVSDPIVAPLIDSAAKAEKLEPKLLRAVIEQESGFHACAVSAAGAMGLMQLMPSTVQQLDVRDPFDPKQSVDAGAKFLKQLLDRYKGDLPLALGAYNAGPTTVDQAGGIPEIPETRNYVDSILQKLGLTRTAPPNTPTPKPTGN